jgi:osmotically-inducible protein OsmY
MLLAEKKTRNARNHLQGFVSEARKLVQGEESVDDRKLTDRIRSKLGRVLLHPSDIEILVANGRVVARGKLERDAAQRALSTIRRIRGVDQVDDQLERVTELS